MVGAADAHSAVGADVGTAAGEITAEVSVRGATVAEATVADSAVAMVATGADSEVVMVGTGAISVGATVFVAMATGRGDSDLATTALLPITTLIVIRLGVPAITHLRTITAMAVPELQSAWAWAEVGAISGPVNRVYGAESKSWLGRPRVEHLLLEQSHPRAGGI
jgi:hypothetical protein